MAEFQWWLLLVGLVAGGGLVAVVLLDGARRDEDVEDVELPAEAGWIADRLAATGRSLAVDDVAAVLREHREYKLLPPPDRLEPVADPDAEVRALREKREARAARAPAPAPGTADVADAAPSGGGPVAREDG